MRILYVTTIGITMRFFEDYVKSLIEEGHIVEIATNEADTRVPDCYREWGCQIHSIPTSRSPFSKSNLTAIGKLRQLTKQNQYDIVHCHTPVAAMCTRLACRGCRKSGTKVIYTAHGFHFYKGAPMKNWLLYYPVEKLCAYFTDILVTINQEDFALAQKKMRAKQVAYVPGVGLDVTKFAKDASKRGETRERLGVPEGAKLLLSVGELNQNKNHETVIRAIANMEDVHYVIAGEGDFKSHLQCVIDEIGVSHRVQLLGFCQDVRGLYAASDVFVMPSFREGLSVALMEAMASGLPCLVSKIRGNTDLVDENGGGLFSPFSVEECRGEIDRMLASNLDQMGKYNSEKIKAFSTERVNEKMKTLYGIK